MLQHVVPENLHTPTMVTFWFVPLPPIPVEFQFFDLYIPLKILVFDTTPQLLAISTNPLWAEYRYMYFLEPRIQKIKKTNLTIFT